MAALTDEEMNRRISAYHRELRHEHLRQQNAIFHSDTTRVLFRHLLGDVTGKQSKPSADVLAVTKGGKMALPVTLKWKVLLVDNATQTSQMFQKFAFDYAKTSSNPIDNFANQIQAFIKKVEQFLDLMMDYTTPKGIHNIHLKIEDFLKRAEDDVQSVVDRILNTVMDEEGNLAEPGAVSALAVGSSKEHGIVMTIFHTIKDLLDMMKSFLPTVITDIKFAKKEVSAVASTLKSIFSIFKAKGMALFNEIASIYASIWTTYYLIFVFLTSFVLFYAFWAYDWFKPDVHEVRQPSDNQAVECCMSFLDCL